MVMTRHLGILTVSTSAVVILSGCVDTQTVSMDTTTPPGQAATTSSPRTGTDSTGSPDPVGVPHESSVDTPPEMCTTNPMASDFAPFLEQERIPTGTLGDGPGSIIQNPDTFYHFQVGTNGYDSCAELSYLVLNGSNGDAERSAGIGAAIQDAVVLFHHGSMIDSPAPFQMKTVEEVTRISDNELEILYGHAGRSTAEGVTENHTFSFIYRDDGLTGEGTLPDEIDNHLRLYLL